MWIRAVLVCLTLNRVDCQQNDQSQYVGSFNGGFVPISVESPFNNVQQNPVVDNDLGQTGFVSEGSSFNNQQGAQPSTFVDNNNIDEFIASVPVPSPTPDSDPVIINNNNDNNNFAASNNQNFNNPLPFNDNNNNQVFNTNDNSVQTNVNSNNNNQVFNTNNNNLANTAPSTNVVNNDSVNFPPTSTPIIDNNINNINNNNNNINNNINTVPAAVVTGPPVVTNAPIVTRPPVVTNAPIVTNPPVATAAPTPAPVALPAESRQQQCYIRSCDQAITGRNLEYNRALQIVQKEEYLSAADLSVIRRRKRHLWSSQPEEKQETEVELVDKLILSPVHNVVKRSSDYCFSQSSNSTTCIPIATGALTTGLMALIFAGAKLVGYFGSRNRPAPVVQNPIQVPSVIVMPPLGLAPSNSVQPGQLGGGELPASNSFAASLAPSGTVPVAVFPPFTQPRTYPAACVIFSERTEFDPQPKPTYNAPTSYNSYNQYYRRKRSPFFPWRIKVRDQSYGRSRSDSYSAPSQQVVYRKFGFRCLVTLVNARCQLGVTCDSNGKKIGSPNFNNFDSILRRQTGEEFSSDAPPDCRTQLAPDGCN